MEFTDEEIKQELAVQGYKNVSSDILEEFKKDLFEYFRLSRVKPHKSFNTRDTSSSSVHQNTNLDKTNNSTDCVESTSSDQRIPEVNEVQRRKKLPRNMSTKSSPYCSTDSTEGARKPNAKIETKPAGSRNNTKITLCKENNNSHVDNCNSDTISVEDSRGPKSGSDTSTYTAAGKVRFNIYDRPACDYSRPSSNSSQTSTDDKFTSSSAAGKTPTYSDKSSSSPSTLGEDLDEDSVSPSPSYSCGSTSNNSAIKMPRERSSQKKCTERTPKPSTVSKSSYSERPTNAHCGMVRKCAIPRQTTTECTFEDDLTDNQGLHFPLFEHIREPWSPDTDCLSEGLQCPNSGTGDGRYHTQQFQPEGQSLPQRGITTGPQRRRHTLRTSNGKATWDKNLPRCFKHDVCHDECADVDWDFDETDTETIVSRYCEQMTKKIRGNLKSGECGANGSPQLRRSSKAKQTTGQVSGAKRHGAILKLKAEHNRFSKNKDYLSAVQFYRKFWAANPVPDGKHYDVMRPLHRKIKAQGERIAWEEAQKRKCLVRNTWVCPYQKKRAEMCWRVRCAMEMYQEPGTGLFHTPEPLA